jgi:hypothetical protein
MTAVIGAEFDRLHPESQFRQDPGNEGSTPRKCRVAHS